ncbi:MAG TPA: chemotaxis protein CheB [Steroidobacteraceae bacterium]|jgi:two-component system chemotaxis response regulator CheB
MKYSSNLLPVEKSTHGVAAVVIGGSAGALDVVRTVLKALPLSIAVPIAIVLHLPPRSADGLAQLLSADTALKVKQAEDKEPLQAGTIYIAPSGYHLLIESNHALALSVDLPVHYSRPAIDVLFESACDVYANRLLGILLSGASQDGAAGMHAIHEAGGITIVQEPTSAESSIMPASALALFDPTYILSAAQIASTLPSLITRATSHGLE